MSVISFFTAVSNQLQHLLTNTYLLDYHEHKVFQIIAAVLRKGPGHVTCQVRFLLNLTRFLFGFRVCFYEMYFSNSS